MNRFIVGEMSATYTLLALTFAQRDEGLPQREALVSLGTLAHNNRVPNNEAEHPAPEIDGDDCYVVGLGTADNCNAFRTDRDPGEQFSTSRNSIERISSKRFYFRCKNPAPGVPVHACRNSTPWFRRKATDIPPLPSAD